MLPVLSLTRTEGGRHVLLLTGEGGCPFLPGDISTSGRGQAGSPTRTAQTERLASGLRQPRS